jgi:hypothetical protein
MSRQKSRPDPEGSRVGTSRRWEFVDHISKGAFIPTSVLVGRQFSPTLWAPNAARAVPFVHSEPIRTTRPA